MNPRWIIIWLLGSAVLVAAIDRAHPQSAALRRACAHDIARLCPNAGRNAAAIYRCMNDLSLVSKLTISSHCVAAWRREQSEKRK